MSAATRRGGVPVPRELVVSMGTILAGGF
jgi:hypothetical protein